VRIILLCHGKNYHDYFLNILQYKFIQQFKKQFDEKKFESDIQQIMIKRREFPEEDIKLVDYSSKIWQFNEYSKEPPIKLKEIPKNEKLEEEIKEEKEEEESSEKLKINEEILIINKLELKKTETINEIINLLKGSISINETINALHNIHKIEIIDTSNKTETLPFGMPMKTKKQEPKNLLHPI